MNKRFFLLLSIITTVLFLNALMFGQETTGEIQGTVKDTAGAVVPNATITIKGVSVGLTRTIQTDDNGSFRARQLPPGSYTVTVEAVSGFAAQTKENVAVTLGNETTLDFAVGTSVGAVVNVTSDNGVMVDPTETKAQSNITQRQIDALPKGTGFTSLLKTTVAVRPEPLGGQFSINGATGPENSFIIDGQETQNYKNGLLNTNNDIPYQALQEIQVKSSGFEAEFGGATGGVINGVTKSGSNQFHGEFGMQLSTNRWNARPRDVYSNTTSSADPTGQLLTYFRQNRDEGVNEYPTALLSGPIIKDKLWFFGIHSPRTVNIQRTTNFIAQSGNTFVPTPLSSTLLNLGATTTQTANEKTIYNYSQLRLDAAPLNSVRINTSYTWNPIVDEGAVLGGTYVIGAPTTLVNNGVNYQGAQAAQFKGGRQNSDNFRIEGIWTPTSNIVALGRYTRGFQNQKLGSYGIPNDPRFICSVAPAAVLSTSGCGVQGFATAANDLIIRDVSIRTTIDAQLSYLFNFGGQHELKGGYQNSKILNDVLSGNQGTGRAYLFYVDPTESPDPLTGLRTYQCFDPSVTYIQWNINAGNTYPCPANSIGTGVNYQFATSGTATNTANTFFIQDKWQPTSRLTLNVGLRDEQEDIPAFNGNAINLKFKWADKIAPRIGVAYALTSDSKTKVSAFYGRFFDRLKFSLPQGSFGGQYYHVSYFYITADKPNYTNYSVPILKGSYNFPAGAQCPITSGSAYVCDQDYRIASNIVGADVLTNGAVDPNVKPYRQSEATFEFQRELFQNEGRATILSARFLYRHLDQAIEDAGIPTSAGEAYVIGNPGQGLAAQVFQQLGYNKAAKPQRVYKALQVEYDTRFMRNLSLNINYTLSRLFGNYSGLASPDEVSTATGIGRADPNVTRSFDEPWVGFTASGTPDNGILPLDRTHVFKASGTYIFDWRGSKSSETDFSFFTTAESGTPKTTFVNVFGIPIPQTKRGDLGRTPMFTQTDLNFSHRYKFGNENRFTVAFDFNVINVFNENNIIAVNQNFHSSSFALAEDDVCASGDPVCATNILTSAGVLNQYTAAETAFGTLKARNIGFNQPIAFQEPRSIRFGFRFFF